MRPEDVIADRRRPYTGAEYIQSLRDGREVYIDGERVLTLRGDNIAGEFRAIVEQYIERRYGAVTAAH